jgi:Na+-translocating ferredoxin:NAD+ oxidoreductase subunit B
MENVYKQLALTLDRIPNGFPGTGSGVELKLLAKLFTPEEAELACKMSTKPQSSKHIAQHIGWDEQKTHSALKGMKRKGLIEIEKKENEIAFKLIPFIVGFYEHQNARIDKEFAELFEAYYKEALHKMMSIKPSVHRVIPIETAVPVNVEVMPYERASFYIDNAKSWGVLPCICRIQKRLVGQGCNHTVENCLVFSSKPGVFDKAEGFRALTKNEALEILSDANKEGLVHSTNNVREGVTYICNCCTCSCGILRGIAEFGHMNAVGRSDFISEVDETLCTGCATCIDRCQFKAVEIRDGMCKVNKIHCYGCGLCVTTCPAQAIHLRIKPAAEIETPPLSESDWEIERTKTRQKESTF